MDRAPPACVRADRTATHPQLLGRRQGAFQLGFTKQRFVVLHTDRLMWFKKGEADDCLLGEVPITEATEVTKKPATLLGAEKITVKTGSKARLPPTGPAHAVPIRTAPPQSRSSHASDAVPSLPGAGSDADQAWRDCAVGRGSRAAGARHTGAATLTRDTRTLTDRPPLAAD